MLKPVIKDKIHINDFVESELDYFRLNCNFSEQELQYFNLKAKDKSNVQIAYELNISESKVSKLARKVKNKIIRIL